VPLAPASMPTPKGFKDYKLFVVDGDTGTHTELHAFNLVSGEELIPPTPFVPAFAEAWSMNWSTESSIRRLRRTAMA
jgi:hypothetical protein